MALTFADFPTLHADLESKAGIEAANPTLPQPIASNWAYNFYDLPIMKKVIDDDGTTRYINATQQLVEEQSSGSFGYGVNRQWDLQDKATATDDEQLKSDVKAYMETMLKKTWGTGKLVKYNIEEIRSDEDHGVVKGYADDSSVSYGIVFYDSSTTAWTHQIVSEK